MVISGWLDFNEGKKMSFSATDEKERFDPSHFQESIVQGLDQCGYDLEAVAKFLDASGGKLDYRRYAESLFDILVAGGMLGKRSYKIFLKLYPPLSPKHGIHLGAEWQWSLRIEWQDWSTSFQICDWGKIMILIPLKCLHKHTLQEAQKNEAAASVCLIQPTCSDMFQADIKLWCSS